MSETGKSLTADDARVIGQQIGIDWATSPFDVKQLRIRMNVELEHGLHDSRTNVEGRKASPGAGRNERRPCDSRWRPWSVPERVLSPLLQRGIARAEDPTGCDARPGWISGLGEGAASAAAERGRPKRSGSNVLSLERETPRKAQRAPGAVAPGEGEQRAQRGLIPQYKVAAEKIYALLAAGRLHAVGLADPEAGTLDDIQLIRRDGSQLVLDAYEVNVEARRDLRRGRIQRPARRTRERAARCDRGGGAARAGGRAAGGARESAPVHLARRVDLRAALGGDAWQRALAARVLDRIWLLLHATEAGAWPRITRPRPLEHKLCASASACSRVSLPSKPLLTFFSRRVTLLGAATRGEFDGFRS